MNEDLSPAALAATLPRRIEAEEVRIKEALAVKTSKPHWTYLPWRALRAVSRVMEFGARKHSPRGWEDVPNVIEVYKNSLANHLAAMMLGEMVDPESGELHSAHAACCALIIAEHEERMQP